MIKTALFLVYIYYRKFFIKGDFLALGLILIGLFGILSSVYQNYESYCYALFLFLIETAFYHQQRNDFSLLKIRTNYQMLIFLEYLIKNAPVWLIFLLKKDIFLAILFIFGLVLCLFLPDKNLKIKYPFSFFDPLWHNTFRRYKLLISIPLCVIFICVAKWYHNENLGIFMLFVTASIAMFPYFEREHTAHINASVFKGADYLQKQLKTGFLNFLWIFTPVLLVFLCFFPKEILFVPFCFLFPFAALISKYALFDNKLSQGIILAITLGGITYGFPIFVFPFLYYKSIKTIKEIQDVTD